MLKPYVIGDFADALQSVRGLKSFDFLSLFRIGRGYGNLFMAHDITSGKH